jgi:hypothetical protein
LETTGRLGLFEEIQPAKDFSVSTTPGAYTHGAYDESAEDAEDGE